MIDFEFFDHQGAMATAELSREGESFVAAWASDPAVRGQGATREEALAQLKQRMPGRGGVAVVERAPSAPPVPKGAARRLGRPGRVLVVDDNPVAIQLASLVCHLCGHAAVGARDGAEAWRHLEAGGVDLVLADLHMPGVGGLALVRALRGRLPDVPVLAVTAAGPNGVHAMEQLGVHGVVRKPYGVQVLAEAIRGLIVPA